MLYFLTLFILFACWGSFLNVVAYRITYNKPFFTTRSYCPSCLAIIRFYDNIPIISWFILGGKCRDCKSPISWLYPFIEILSGVIFTALFLLDGYSFIPWFIFFSALIISTRTDLEAMIIPQIFSLWLIPLGVLFSFMGLTNILVYESVLGAFMGYGVLWSIGAIFKYLKKVEGIGVGDMELLGMIGSFIGITGVWLTLLIGSLSGLIIGGGYLLVSGKGRYARMPFGPFLALGATIFIFFGSYLKELLFY